MTRARVQPEWPAVKAAAVKSDGRRPIPIRQFILKVHSRCNLACDYCYVYRMADQTWRDQPRVMSGEILRLAADRIAEHADRHGLSRIGVVLHGGEPLLAGPAFFAEVARTLRTRMPASTAVALTVQSNGVLLTRPMLDLLAEHDIAVAVSIDGGPTGNDHHRRYPNGRGSYADVARGLELLGSPAYRRLFAGLLCTVDLAHDPVTTYADLLWFGPPRMDFLLPHGNWTAPPPGRVADAAVTPYADWLGAVFDRWYDAPEQVTELRLFREIIHLLLGGVSHFDSLGLAPAAIAVIETDGSLGQADALKSAFSGASATGLHVATATMDELLRHPTSQIWQDGLAALADECRNCAVREICGGGFYPHRYRAGAGFRNPSVYCPDLFALIRRIRTRVVHDLDRLAAAH